MHTWSHDNQHETSVANFQRRFTVNVMCGVLGNKLIGPFVYDNNLTGNAYEFFLRNELPDTYVGRHPVNDTEPNVLPT